MTRILTVGMWLPLLLLSAVCLLYACCLPPCVWCAAGSLATGSHGTGTN